MLNICSNEINLISYNETINNYSILDNGMEILICTNCGNEFASRKNPSSKVQSEQPQCRNCGRRFVR